MNWKYGEYLVDIEVLESLNDWSDLKEEVIPKMDNYYDYGDWDTDECVEQRRKNNELKMCFKTIEEVKEWIDKKEKSKEIK